MSDADRVLRMLHNATVVQADMAFALGIPIRKVQEAIQELRLAGHPIISDGDGIRLARNAEEAAACAASLRRRAIHQFLTARALRRTARRMAVAEDNLARLTLWGPFGEVTA